MNRVLAKALLCRASNPSPTLGVLLGTLIATPTVLPASAAQASPPPIIDIGGKLHARQLGNAYQTTHGIGVCVKTAAGWFPWFVSHPQERATPSSSCKVPGGAKFVDPEVIMEGRAPWTLATLSAYTALRDSSRTNRKRFWPARSTEAQSQPCVTTSLNRPQPTNVIQLTRLGCKRRSVIWDFQPNTSTPWRAADRLRTLAQPHRMH